MAKIIDASHTSDTHRYNTFPSSTLSRTTTTPHWWQPLSLGAVMLVSIFMNFYQLVTLINNGTVRYFLLDGGGGPGGSSSVITWVTQHCTDVSSSAWQSTSTSSSNGPGGASQLYSCTATK